MQALRVLLVEDDDQLRNCLAQLLRRTPHRVICAAGPETALRFLATEAFDVLVTDMLLGAGDGIDVISAARAALPDIRIVAMSGGDDDFRASSCLSLAVAFGASAPLVKPFSFEELRSAIEGSPAPVAA